MSGRLLGPLSMLVLVALYTGVGRDPVAALVLGPLALLPALLPWRLRLGLVPQALLSLALLALAAVLVRVLPGPQLPFRGVMGPLVPFLAMGSILIASHRLLLDEPAGGDRATAAHGFWCLVACGSQRAGLPYVLGCALYLALASAWLRGPSHPWALGRHRGWWAAILALSAALAGLFAWVIPRAHARVVGWLIDSTTTQIGLQDGPLELGSLAGLADSDRVVARVFHFQGDPLLRGVVYQEYARGRWIARPASLARSLPIQGAGGPVELRYEPTELPRFLLPLAARKLLLNTPSALVDGFGIVAPIYGTSAQWARYEPAPREQLDPEPPRPVDLQLPEKQRGRLTALARLWVEGAVSPEEQLQRIKDRLQAEHPYATSFQRPPGVDPLLAFLETPGSGGHCEYFASAAALLGRALGIPTRLVGGYRLTEYNRAGGYHVVRERNAHAWVEAYLEGRGWVSLDTTPPASLEVAGPAETPWLWGWLDAVRTRSNEGLQWVLDNPSALGVGLGPVVVFIVGRDLWRRWAARRGGRGPGYLERVEAPLPWLQRLLEALAREGLERGGSEPLEALARRVEAARAGDPAAGLLRGYAALRYGGEGDEGALRAAVERHLAERGAQRSMAE